MDLDLHVLGPDVLQLPPPTSLSSAGYSSSIMGTRGYRAVRRKGKYFITYNHWDSYPSGLGKDIVDTIPVDPGAYQKWLQETIEHWDSVYAQYCDENGRWLTKDENPNNPLDHDLVMYPSELPPLNDVLIEWTYTIDLDHMAFTVDSHAHFRLDSIPRDTYYGLQRWELYLDLDRGGQRCLKPATPQEYVADMSLPPPEVDAAGLSVYKSLESSIVVDPGAFPSGDTPEEKMAALDAFTELREHYAYFTRASELTKDDPRFKAIALALLSTASPLFIPSAALFAGSFKSLCFRFENFVNSRDSRPSFWIRGVLVHLSTHLESERHLFSQLGPLVQRLRSERAHTQVPQITGLLWSTKAFVAVNVTATSIVRSAVNPVGELLGAPESAASLKKSLSILPPLLQMKTAYTAPFFSARVPFEVMELILTNIEYEVRYLSLAPLCKTLFYYIHSHPHPCHEERINSLLFGYGWYSMYPSME